MPTSKNNTVRRTLDLTNPPALTAGQKARLDALAAQPDERIDLTEAPHLPDAVWAKAADLPDMKQQITLRLDADVVDFFRSTGKRYQTRINAVLRSYVQAHKAPAK